MSFVRSWRLSLLAVLILVMPAGIVHGGANDGNACGRSGDSGRKVQQTEVDIHHWTTGWDMNDSNEYTISNLMLQKGHSTLAVGPAAWNTVGPRSRAEHVTVWDSLHNTIIIQGGYEANPQYTGLALNDTWAYDNAAGTWKRLADGPRLVHHAGVWDSQNNQMLMYGGWNFQVSGQSSELWAYDPAADLWSKKAVGPPARANHSAVWDPVNRQMLVFGGEIGWQETNELWAYRPSTNAWSQKSSGATARKAQGACWDSLDRVMLIFGGYYNHRDTWAYDPAADRWTQYATMSGWFNDAGAVWDDQGNRMIVMYNQEMWTFSPATNTYTEFYHFPLGGSPHTMIWNSQSSKIYYCAGAAYFYSFPPSTRVWRSEWGGYPECYHSAVWDPMREQMVVFGGSSGAWSPTYNTPETWAYKPSKGTWTRKSDWPDLGDGYTAVWDTKNNQAILYGGSTWTYNPATDTWKARADGPPREDHRAVWDSQNNQMIVYGGWDGYSTIYNDVWTYNPATDVWKMMNPGGVKPYPMTFPSAAWDRQNNQMLVFGGSTYDGTQILYLDDLWAYVPATNIWVFKGKAPTAVARHAAVWDDVHNQMIICGGLNDAPPLKDTWAYVPVTNKWVEQPAHLEYMRDHTAVWDGADSQMLVFGGQNGSGAMRELHSFGVPFLPSGEMTAAPRLLSPSFFSIDRIVWNATVPAGTSLQIWARTANSPPGWTNWTLLDNNSRPPVQGRNLQWKAVFSSPGGLRTPVLDNLTVCFTTDLFPIVSAETDLSVYRKETAFLNATASDADDDPLAYLWNQTGGPPVEIRNPTDANASFVSDVPGLYSFSFTASDPFGDGAPAFVNVTVLNHRPLAFAPAMIKSFRRDVVLLNGSGRDGDGDVLSFRWAQLSGPPVQLKDPRLPVASFTPAEMGNYTFGLVASDPYDESDAAVATVAVKNRVPVADAGKDLVAHRRETVLLNGSGCDGDGDMLNFSWSGPENVGSLQNAGAARATFVPAQLGIFTFQLVVNDGHDSSAPSLVNVTVINRPPAADAGPDGTADVNTTVQLPGSGSDDDGDTLSFRWVQTGGPPVMLSGADLRVASFVPSVPGFYSFRLTVHDTIDEASDSVNVTVVDRSHPPRFTSLPPSRARPGELYKYTVRYADTGGTGNCTLELLSGPAGLALRPGAVAWTPGGDQLGKFNVSLALSDGYSTVYQNWTILVSSEPGGTGPGGSDTPLIVAGALIAIVAAAAAGLAVLRRRRPKAQPAGPAAEASAAPEMPAQPPEPPAG